MDAQRTGPANGGVSGRRATSRFILYNALLWLAVFFAGVAYLSFIREYGTGLTTRYNAQTLVNSAAEAHAQGDAFQATQQLRRALETYPSIAGAIVDRFGADLLGLPVLRAELRAAMNTPAAQRDIPAVQRAKFHILQGELAEAEAVLEEASGRSRQDPGAWLLLVRIRLERGDPAAAHDAFARYWAAAPHSREPAVTAILGEDGPGEGESVPPLVLYRLLHVGLWDEAFALAATLRENNPDIAEGWRIAGLEAEVNGAREEAIAHYERALELLPNHLAARQGLERLTD